MKNNILFLWGTLILFFSSCSSNFSITDHYAVPDIAQSKGNNFVVIVRASDSDIRNTYESALAKELNNSGIKAKALGDIMSNINPNEKITESQVDSFIENIKSQNYNGVVLTVLKNVKQQTQTYSNDVGFYGMYPGYYYGFGGYYMNPWAFADYSPTTYTTDTYKVYQVQTNVYDLNRPLNKQLISVVSSEVSDPSNFISIADNFASKVVKAILK